MAAIHRNDIREPIVRPYAGAILCVPLIMLSCVLPTSMGAMTKII